VGQAHPVLINEIMSVQNPQNAEKSEYGKFAQDDYLSCEDKNNTPHRQKEQPGLPIFRSVPARR
jgi:hypothetical protein